jgi:hypothetical protein
MNIAEVIMYINEHIPTLGASAVKLQNRSYFAMSVGPLVITSEPLNGFSLYLILRSSNTICRHILSLVEIRQQ